MKLTHTTNQVTNDHLYIRNKTDISSLRGCFNTLSSSVNTKLKNQAIEHLHNFFKLGGITPDKVKGAIIKGTDLSKNNVSLKIKDMYFFEHVGSNYVLVDKNTSKEGVYSFLPFDANNVKGGVLRNV